MNESRRSHRSWGPRTFGVLGLLLAAGCFYQFDNPVEKEPPGSVAGTIALQGAVGNQTAAGGMITVQWTNGLELSLTTSSKFLFQDLPDGTYSLEVTIPPAMGNDFPLELLRPDVLIPNVGDMIDSLDIGTLQVPASGTVGGTVTSASGVPAAGVVVGAFAPGTDMTTPGIYEGFHTSTDSNGNYSLQVPSGNHVLAASDPSNNASGTATVVPEATQSLDLTLKPAGGFLGQIDGSLIGSGFGASATGPVPWDGATYVALDPGGKKVADGGLIPPNSSGASAGTGSDFTINLQGGELVTLVLLPAPEASTNPCDNFGPFTLPAVPVFQGQATELGQVTWLNDAALGANGIGPCADGGSSVTDDGGMEDGGPSGPTGWIDAGVIGLDGGNVAQIGVYPQTSHDGGILVAWIEGQTGQFDLNTEAVQTSGTDTFRRSTTVGQVSPGSLSGAQIGNGVLLTFSTYAAPGLNATYCEFFPGDGSKPASVAPTALPGDPGLGAEQTTTFTGQLDGGNGVFVFQAQLDDAGVVGVFSSDGVSFGPLIGLEPGGAIPVMVDTLIGTSCDVADLKGKPGFCLAGSGALDIDGGSTPVGFVSSFATDGPAPVLSAAIFTAPPNFNPPIYVGLTALPGEVAVAMGTSQEAVYYWTLTDLTVDAGGGTVIGVATDLLLSYDGSVLGLSQPAFNRTDLQFLPNGAQPAPLPFFVNGGDFPAAYVDPLNNDIVTAGVASMGPDAYNGTISILRLAPDAG